MTSEFHLQLSMAIVVPIVVVLLNGAYTPCGTAQPQVATLCAGK